MLISEQYAAENARQHALENNYGVRGYKHLPDVLHLAEREGCTTVLDYGCGAGTLAARAKKVSPLKFTNYDPGRPEFSATPSPADLVVCTDVLEHVEPLCLADVVQDLVRLADKAIYLQIATRPAGRILSDGRNAHLIIRDPYFWFDTFRLWFDITDMKVVPGHSVALIGKRMGSIYQ